jgi:dihydroorotate dehydrogenase electron transfer subunit
MKKRVKDLLIFENKQLNKDTFILYLKDDESIDGIMPGHFVEVLVKDSTSTFLRRPISIHDVDKENNIISLFIKIVGEGTRKLSELKANDTLNVMYPLGNSFCLEKKDQVLMVGGGCGIAPLLFLARWMKAQKVDVHILLGGRTSDDILQIEEYKKYGNVFYTTEDGSKGEKGFVTQHSILKMNTNYQKVYSCGPEPMMKAVAKWAREQDIDCEVSLENTMACGIGACLCCVTETKNGNQCVCTEGPVFNINDLQWQI